MCLPMQEMQEMQVWSLGWDYPLAPFSSILTWEIPWAEAPGGLQFVESEWDTTEQAGTHTNILYLVGLCCFHYNKFQELRFYY